MSVIYDQEKDEIVIESEPNITFDKIYEILSEPVVVEEDIELTEEEIVWRNNPNANANENAFKTKIKDGKTYKTVEVTYDWSGCIKKCENGFIIDCSVRLKEGTHLWSHNQFIRINGPLFQIEPFTSFRMGQKTYEGQHKNGGYLYMPNPALAYGFGGNDLYEDATRSGDVFLYDSRIDVSCFWGFFAGQNQRVEIERCNINGFGRVEGSTSIVDNVYFTESHPRYGVLSPKGELKKYANITVLKSQDCAVYFNGALSNDMILRGGKYDNYKKLVFAEPTDQRLVENDKTISFIDADIPSKNYEMSYGKNTHITINFTFNPIIVDKDKRVLSNLFVCIQNKQEEIVWEGYTNASGQIDGKIYLPVYYNNYKGERTEFNPYKVVFKGTGNDDEEIDYELVFDHKVPWDRQPLIVPPKIEIEYINDGASGGGNPGDGTDIGGWDGVIDPNAPIVIYVNGPSDGYNNQIKAKIKEAMPPELSAVAPVYTDKTKDAYSERNSYNAIMKLALVGKIKEVWTWEPETFGISRKDLTMQMLDIIGVKINFVKYGI